MENIKDYDTALVETEKFLPYIDNWATCDCFCPKVFAKHKEELLIPIRRWLNSDKIYTVRYVMGMLMRYYLDEEFRTEYLGWVADVHSEEYYLNMMRAWYFATALAKQPEAALPWLTTRRLDTWTHNKTIQKAVESFRITPEMKQQLCSCASVLEISFMDDNKVMKIVNRIFQHQKTIGTEKIQHFVSDMPPVK